MSLYISRKLVCEASPPATEVPWRAWIRDRHAHSVRVVAQTAYKAWHLAAPLLRCEPGQVEVRMLKKGRKSA
jgi:hypothetical protein